MNDTLFNPPSYLPLLLAALALVLLYQGVKMQKKEVKFFGLVAAALAAAWMGAASWVETGKEIAARQTYEIAAAVDVRDWTKFKSLIDPNAVFYRYAGRDEITEGAKLSVEKVGVKDIVVSGLDVQDEPGGYNVTFTATAAIGAIDQRAPTNWKFFWAKDDAGKELLYKIEVLPSAGMGTEPVTTRLAKP